MSLYIKYPQLDTLMCPCPSYFQSGAIMRLVLSTNVWRYFASSIIHKHFLFKSQVKVHIINSMCKGPLACLTVFYKVKVLACFIPHHYQGCRRCLMTLDNSLGVHQRRNHLGTIEVMGITMLHFTRICKI